VREFFHYCHKWNAEQAHDCILFPANIGLRLAWAKNPQHRNVAIVEDEATGETILEIEVRGKHGVSYCESMLGALCPYEGLLGRAKPVQAEVAWRSSAGNKGCRTISPSLQHSNIPTLQRQCC
jgi:CelD/BcsL family acetyltransferase involved in cellulose biosynthesis